MKRYHVSIALAANDRMYDHFEFLAKVSETAARNLLSELLKDIKSLELTPKLNPYFNRPYLEQRKYRYKLSYRRYRIVYQIVKDRVFVDDIQDCRQDDDKNLI